MCSQCRKREAVVDVEHESAALCAECGVERGRSHSTATAHTRVMMPYSDFGPQLEEQEAAGAAIGTLHSGVSASPMRFANCCFLAQAVAAAGSSTRSSSIGARRTWPSRCGRRAPVRCQCCGVCMRAPVLSLTLRGTVDQETAARFVRELSVQQQIHSPYFVGILGCCVTPRVCSVMEHCARGSVRGDGDDDDDDDDEEEEEGEEEEGGEEEEEEEEEEE